MNEPGMTVSGRTPHIAEFIIGCTFARPGGSCRLRSLTPNLIEPADCRPTSVSQQGADAMNDHDEWTSYSQWGMFPVATKVSR
jgi:hypothetical protein